MRILVHTRNRPNSEWSSQGLELAQVPCVGDYLVINTDSDWHEVRLVVHIPVQKADHNAEIYAVPVEDQNRLIDGIRKARATRPDFL